MLKLTRYIKEGLILIGIQIEKINENLIIKWQFSKVTIPISDIMAITNDDTYGGEGKSAIRIF